MSAVATLPNPSDALRGTRTEIRDGGTHAERRVSGDARSPDAAPIPRSASYTYIPRTTTSPTEPSTTEISEAASEGDLADTASRTTSTASFDSCESSSDTAPSPPPSDTVSEDPRHAGSRRPSTSTFSLSSRTDTRSGNKLTKRQPPPPHASVDPRSRSDGRRGSGTASPPAASSTTPDPSATTRPGEASPGASTVFDTVRRNTLRVCTTDIKGARATHHPSPATPGKRGNVLSRTAKKPLSALLRPSGAAGSPSLSPPVPRIPTSFSTDRLPSVALSPPPHESVPPLPDIVASDKLRPARLDLTRKKDELWSVFRTLDGDFQKFQSKPTSLKGNVVRQTLLPFLRAYASHPSTRTLRVEDLDRRSTILNKWWTSLLDLLDGRNHQSLAGTDRPAILDGLVGIMERPEWRRHPSPFCPRADRTAPVLGARSPSSTSVTSASSDFLHDSVHHNVRNVFVQNLTAQLAFVVDRMSLRSAPASLVTFCGKTCAYAFLFCPGAADLLVRLWTPSLDNLRRVYQANQGSTDLRATDASRRIVAAFPPCLQSLRFRTVVTAARALRTDVPPPLGTAKVEWRGAWLKRWSGKESDLFYVFVKHYYILVADFLPADATKAERNFIPGLIMVQAQILENLTATVYRNATPSTAEEPSSGPSSITFDDVLGDPDASASAVPLPPANATRLMAENRLVMLIRDFLSDRNAHHRRPRHMFAEAFCDTLKACARTIPIYDTNACFTLCDFLEEAIAILVRYEHAKGIPGPILDWPFWLSVFKKMTESHNTTTEIRLYAFLYSIWMNVMGHEQRKMELCTTLLLEPEFFASRFNHWCPMVRAYFMRLLVWRVARWDEETADADLEILGALFSRLKSVWSHHQYLKEDAEAKREPLPATAPCSPAPGRRILIIRTDAPLTPNGNAFLSFDGIVPSDRTDDAASTKKQSALSKFSESNLQPLFGRMGSTDSLETAASAALSRKKNWNFLRTFMPSKARSSSPSARARSDSNTSSATVSPPSSGTTTPNNGPHHAAPHRSFCFKFSLEWMERRAPAPAPPRVPPPRLPAPAQNALMVQLSERGTVTPPQPTKPEGPDVASSRYAGRALAEWMIVVNECQIFFDRRLKEGVPTSRMVETPTLSFETFKAPR